MDDRTYNLHPISLGNVSAFLLFRPGEAILVDSGNPGSEEKILTELATLGIQPEMLKLLVLTHAHFDHSGSAARIKALTGCKIMIHHTEASRLGDGFTLLPPGTRWKAKLLIGAGRVIARRIGRFPPSQPDLLVKETFDLHEFGFPGQVVHTPGHTTGSMVVLMENGELLAGDTLFGLLGKQHFPPFAEDLPALVESWKSIRNMKVTTIYPAHGRPITRESFMAEYEGAIQLYG